MVWFTVLFIVILTTVSKVTSLHCYDQLDIVYTTDSLIVTTPTDGHTSTGIAKQENVLPCLKPAGRFDDHWFLIVVVVVMHLLLVVVSGYTIAVHAMFKELQNLFGKLIMFCSAAVLCLSIPYTGLLVGRLLATHSLVFCYLFLNGSLLSVVSYEASGACVFNHIAFTMHHSYKLRSPMSKETSQHHFRFYAVYTLGIICFDVAIGNYKDVLLPNGQCISVKFGGHDTIIVMLPSIR